MKLVDKVREYAIKRANDVAADFLSSVDVALDKESQWSGRFVESPIEQLFLIEWEYQETTYPSLYPFTLEPQYISEPMTGKYILDFMVEFACDLYGEFPSFAFAAVPIPLLGIELDGHVWHEKTKHQVEYHKERERFLISKGWKILRFAGSEIYRDPEKCVVETIKMAWSVRTTYLNALKSASEK